MRVLKKNADDSFRVKAYAGTNGVLLAFDVSPARRKGLLGFAIEQQEAGKPRQWLLNSLTFEGQTHTLVHFNATQSNRAPIQKFRWADYSIAPKTTCRYRVHLVYGSASQPELQDALELEIKTDDGQPKDHRVIFNRAVAASQAFGRKFADLDAQLKEQKDMPIEQWPDEARKWLENGLLDQILAVLDKAADSSWALDIAIYEYELKAIVDAVNAAHKRGAKVRVIYHAQPGDKQTAENIKSLAKIPKASKRARVTGKIFHDKFIVLSKLDSAGQRKPQQVLCGSTNFTENGVYRQANVVHVTKDKTLMARYAEMFGVLWDNAEDVPATRAWITANNPLDGNDALFAGFSPRTGRADLAHFNALVGAADIDLLFATAFKLPEALLDALLGAPHDSVLRYGIQNSASRITGYHADRTAEFTAPAFLSNGLEGWAREGLRGQRGNLMIHLKAIVCNFTTDNPTVISGSHNLSVAASESNDENFLIMSGDTDLADRYGIELLRFYDHYRFRYYARELKLKKVRPLVDGDDWSDDYYKPGNLKALSRARFAGRSS